MASGSLDCDVIADNLLVDVTLKVEARSKTFRQETTCWRMPSSQMPFGGLSKAAWRLDFSRMPWPSTLWQGLVSLPTLQCMFRLVKSRQGKVGAHNIYL